MNSIDQFAVLGSTFDGSYEPVAEICAALDDLQQRSGLDVPVHVLGGRGRAARRRSSRGLTVLPSERTQTELREYRELEE